MFWRNFATMNISKIFVGLVASAFIVSAVAQESNPGEVASGVSTGRIDNTKINVLNCKYNDRNFQIYF